MRAKANELGANTVNALLDAFLERHVRRNLRSAGEVERIFDRYVRPAIGKMPVPELRRRDVVALLDGIEDQNGPVMADRTLAHVRKALNWGAATAFLAPVRNATARLGAAAHDPRITSPALTFKARDIGSDLCGAYHAGTIRNASDYEHNRN